MRRTTRLLVALLCLFLAAPSAMNAVGLTQKRRPRRKPAPAATPAPTPAPTPEPQPSAGTINASGPARLPPGKSVDQAVADALNDSINEALRKPADGETRRRAVFTAVECGKKGLVFAFKDGERALRLTAPGFGGLHITAYTPDAGTEMTCGRRKKESVAVVTFRPSADAAAKIDGALVAVEFVPASFKLKP